MRPRLRRERNKPKDEIKKNKTKNSHQSHTMHPKVKLQFELSGSSFKPITQRGNKTIIIKAAFQSEDLMRKGCVRNQYPVDQISRE